MSGDIERMDVVDEAAELARAAGGTGRMAGWVPAAVVAGAVLLIEGWIVSNIRPAEGGEFTRALSLVSWALGSLSVVAGYFAFVRSKVSLARAFESVVLSGAALALYGVAWVSLAGLLFGKAADLWFTRTAGLEGRAAQGVAVVVLLAGVGGFAWCFRHVARTVWPYFRAGVALNVLAMLHLVVLLLGFVSAVNHLYTPRYLGTGIDLTATDRFSLSDRTGGVLDEVTGDLTVLLLDYRRNPDPVVGTGAVRDLLHEYEARSPRVTFRSFDAFRESQAVEEALLQANARDVIGELTGADDVLVLAYTVPGERAAARVRLLPIDQDFADLSALGNRRFRGENLVTNAINELVFVQRRAYFTVGHGELAVRGAPTPQRSLAEFVDSLRRDNFAVGTLDLSQTNSVPVDADLVVIGSPQSPFSPGAVEALRTWVAQGGSLITLLDLPSGGRPASGLEDLLATFGIEVRRDAMLVSYIAQNTALGRIAGPKYDVVIVPPRDLGRHPMLRALRDAQLPLTFLTAAPVLPLASPPPDATVFELASAPREVDGLKPFGALFRPGRSPEQAEDGDIQNRRLHFAMAAERDLPGTKAGSARIVVFGDGDFATDAVLDRAPPNRSFLVNAASWAVRKNLLEIDPKSIETERVTLRAVERDVAYWIAVIALPILTLGLALGVWWKRRR